MKKYALKFKEIEKRTLSGALRYTIIGALLILLIHETKYCLEKIGQFSQSMM